MMTNPVHIPLWQEVIQLLQERISPQNFKIWMEPVRASFEGDRLVLVVPNHFFRDWISEHYLSIIQEIVCSLVGSEIAIDFDYEENLQQEASPTEEEALALLSEDEIPPPEFEISATHLNQRYTFDSFVVGPSNQFAHAACRAVAEEPAKSYNPLFIYGGVGLGKTHLLHAIGWELHEKLGWRVLYLSAEQFMNDMINAVRFEKLVDFRGRYRNHCDVLLIDDIQFIAGKKMTQEEFFHTFNFLHGSNKQIVVTSDKYPKEIHDLEERLRSRFQWGLITDIQAPELETRMAILTKKAERDGVYLSNDVALYLANAIKSNIRELEGCLIRLEAYSSLTGREISLDMVHEVMKNLIPGEQQRVSLDVIQKAVSEHYGIKVSELKGSKRNKQILIPRQVAMFLARKLAGASYPEIGNKFGGKDHSTVINACQKIERMLKSDLSLQSTIELIAKNLET